MCGQWSHSPQSQRGSRSPIPGSSATPASAASSAGSGGTSRSSSAAMYPDSAAARPTTRSHSASVNRWTSTSVRCAVPSGSRTTAVRPPGRTDTAPTAPRRAYRRPCRTCSPSSAPSSRARNHACPHQVPAKPRPGGGSAGKVFSSVFVTSLPGRVRAQRHELGELGVGQFGERALAAREDGVGEGPLGLQQPCDAVLDGALGDEPVDLYGLGLPDPVGAVGGLLLHGRVHQRS